MKHLRFFPLIVGCVLALSCRNAAPRPGGNEPPMHSYLLLLERLEVSVSRYRHATDLLKYSGSSVERSLAESHLLLARQFLESEFQLAGIYFTRRKKFQSLQHAQQETDQLVNQVKESRERRPARS